VSDQTNYDGGLQPASASLAHQTCMRWSPDAIPAGGFDSVSLAISEALNEIQAAATARVAHNNAAVESVNVADMLTGSTLTAADEDSAAGISQAARE
jgi:hypothetical protein